MPEPIKRAEEELQNAYEKKYSNQGVGYKDSTLYGTYKKVVVKAMESFADIRVRESCKAQEDEMLKKLNAVLEKIHSRRLKDAGIHLGTIIYCLENPSVEPPTVTKD